MLDSIQQRQRVGRLRDAGLNDGKLVAAQPCQRIALTHAATQALGHGLQQLVAERMAVRIVHVLEVIEIEAEHRQVLAAANPGERLLEPSMEQHAVGQIGQRVVQRHVGDLVFGTLPLRNVLDDRQEILRLALFVADDELSRHHAAQAVAGRRERMLVAEESVARLQYLRVVREDAGGILRRQDILNGLAHQLAAGQAEKPLGRAIDQDISALAGLLDDDRGGHVLDHGVEELAGALQLLFGAPPAR